MKDPSPATESEEQLSQNRCHRSCPWEGSPLAAASIMSKPTLVVIEHSLDRYRDPH